MTRPTGARPRTGRRPSLTVLPLVAATVAALAGCAPTESSTTAAPSSSDAAAASPARCSKDALDLESAGKLTIGTDKPAFPPWFVDDDPTNGKGFESAVAYAVANRLGFTQEEVSWTVASFSSVIAPGPKSFDFDINQVSITDERRQGVDFSTGYYDVTQAIITVKGSKVENATTIADLQGAKIGAQVGTTSLQTITDTIKPTQDPSVYNTNDDAKAALSNGQVDALVLDLPTALFEVAADLKDGVLIGQFPNRDGGTPEQFGLVLDKGSKLTSCVSEAVDSLRADGSLAKIQEQWLTSEAGAPVLR